MAGVVWIVLVIGLAELTARAYWRIAYGLSVFSSRSDAATLYPEIRRPLALRPSRSDSTIDVLLLGGSTVNVAYGSIAPALQERLSAATHRRVQIFNLGMPAHTSLDSYYKYRALAGVGFDLVVLYDGFNEVRANNAPPGVFRDDYSHFAFYAVINDVLGAHRLRPFALPYTVRYAIERARESMATRAGHPVHVPTSEPDSAWTKYGGDVRTPKPFRHNVEGILDLAAARGEPAVIMTFASYIAPGYSEAAFHAHSLDYATHYIPVELWGRPEFVAAGVAAHNDVIRAVHASRRSVGFVDMNAAIPHAGAFFNDVCHLTVAGSERFADALFPVALAQLAARFPVVDAAAARSSGPKS